MQDINKNMFICSLSPFRQNKVMGQTTQGESLKTLSGANAKGGTACKLL